MDLNAPKAAIVSAAKSRGRGKGRTNPGDVANLLIRCLLSDASEVVGTWTDADRERTLAYFGNRCAFTGQPYDPDTFVWDHLVPHNKEACGLHVYGNLVPASRKANAAKGDKDYCTFLRGDHVVLGDMPPAEREERIRLLDVFRHESGYAELSEELGDLGALCVEQYERLKAICQENREVVRAHLAPKAGILKIDLPTQGTRRTLPDGPLPVEYEVTPPSRFLDHFLEAGIAYIVEHYADGHTRVRPWEARKLKAKSNLVGNIRSKPEYRYGNWQSAGLTKLELRLSRPGLT